MNRFCLMFLLAIALFGACKKVESQNASKIITNDDYFISYEANDMKVYHNNDNTKMTGHYLVKSDSLTSEEFNVNNGLLNGLHKSYYPDGSLANTILYKEGKKNGEDIFYYNSGDVKRKSEFLENELTGKSIEYREDGSIYMEIEKENGKSHSKFFDHGKLIQEEYDIDYNNRTLGVSKVYDPSGDLKLSLGFIMVDNTMKDDILYILNENDKVVDSIDPKKDKMKAIQLMMAMGKGF